MPHAGLIMVAMAKPAAPLENTSQCEDNLCEVFPYKQLPHQEVDAGHQGARKAGQEMNRNISKTVMCK